MSPRCAALLPSALLVASVAAQTPWFKAPVMLDGMPGELRLLGDLDGDGDLDAVSFTGTAAITPMYGDGRGHLTAGLPVALPAGTGPLAAMADLDGDGIADLVTTRLNSSPLGPALLIHPGTGSGVFAAPIVRPLPGNVWQLLRGNADGDGIADLLVMHFGSASPTESRWLHGDPTRTFALGPSSAAIPFASEAVVVELDGDGIDDVVTVVDNPTGPDAAALWATRPAGFAALGSLPIAAGLGAVLVATDYDGDGDRDVFAISFVASRTLTFTRLRHDGGANWVVAGAQTRTNTALGLRWFAADWDGDGHEDLLVRESGSGSSISPYHNFSTWTVDGSGLVAPATTQLIPEFFAQESFGGAGPADLDGDGFLDFVDSKALVFGDGTFADPHGPQRVVQLDWDRDGDVDSLPSGGVGINDGTGAVVEHAFALSPAPAGQFFSSPLLITDLDGDGLHESIGSRVAVQLFPPMQQFLDMRLFHEAPGFLFVDAGAIAAPGVQMLGRILADDVDGDGDKDLVTRQGPWLNNGQNFFTLGSPSFGSYEPRDLVDLDGDGACDIVAVKFDGGLSLAVYLRTGPAAWTQTVLTPATSNIVATPSYAIADLDDDGDADIVVTEEVSGGPTRTVLFENQGGALALRTTLTLVGAYAPGDVDVDGQTDLCVSTDRRLHVLRRTGPWTYAAPVVFAMDPIASLVDVDQDGDLDACGQTTIANRTFDLPAAGQRRQYGAGGIGAGGHQPVLSLVGPVRPGLAPQLRLRNAPGGTFALMLIGVGPNDAPSLFLPGVTSYVAGIADLWLFVLSGAPGVPGAGALDLAVPISASLAGLDAFLQAVVADPSLPAGVGYTNGLEVRIGL